MTKPGIDPVTGCWIGQGKPGDGRSGNVLDEQGAYIGRVDDFMEEKEEEEEEEEEEPDE
jgi:hypothetical protein